MTFDDLIDCVFATWTPTIGDPTIMGWVTVAAYSITFLLTASVFIRKTSKPRIFWAVLSVALLALAINKQLDLQSALTATGRCLAKAQGWYENRQIYQIRVIYTILGVSLVALIALFWALRRNLATTWLALIGLGLLFGFVGIRAAGFHHFDSFIGISFGFARVNWVIEIGGIAMIGLNALYLQMRNPRADD